MIIDNFELIIMNYLLIKNYKKVINIFTLLKDFFKSSVNCKNS